MSENKPNKPDETQQQLVPVGDVPLQARPVGVFEDPNSFNQAQRIGKMLVTSSLVPEAFRGANNLGNALIAIDIAQRLKMNPLMVMQQIYIVHGKPGFSAQFFIAVMNTNGDFGKVRYERAELGEKEVEYREQNVVKKVKIRDVQMVAWAVDGRDTKLPAGVNTLQQAKEKGVAVLEGPPVTLSMAIKDGWYFKAGSKWQTMEEVMLRYRAAAFFGRIYAPELMMGLPTVEELEDIPFEPQLSRPIFQVPAKVDASPPPITEPAKPEPPPHSVEQKPWDIGQKQPEPKKESTPLKVLNGLLAQDKVSGDQLLGVLVGTGVAPDEIKTLEELALNKPDVVNYCIANWPKVLAKIKYVSTPKPEEEENPFNA